MDCHVPMILLGLLGWGLNVSNICVLMSLGDVVVAGVVEERHGGVDGRGQLPGLPRAGVPPAGGTGRVDLKMDMKF